MEWLRSIAEWFSPDVYLPLTRIQGSLWTLADYLIVIYLIRTANVVRRYLGRRNHFISYIFLVLTIPFALLLPVAPSGASFFRLELLVTAPHFLLLVYICMADARLTARAFATRFAQPKHSTASLPSGD